MPEDLNAAVWPSLKIVDNIKLACLATNLCADLTSLVPLLSSFLRLANHFLLFGFNFSASIPVNSETNLYNKLGAFLTVKPSISKLIIPLDSKSAVNSAICSAVFSLYSSAILTCKSCNFLNCFIPLSTKSFTLFLTPNLSAVSTLGFTLTSSGVKSVSVSSIMSGTKSKP